MKRGDRVAMIAPSNEYTGFCGAVLEVTNEGNLVVAVEVKSVMTWNATFSPRDVELEQRAKLRRPND